MEIAPITPQKLALSLIITLLVGCSATNLEPESAWSELPPQRYSFETVWECLVEAAELEGFVIDTSQRDGDRAEFTTEFVRTSRDPVGDLNQGQRVRATVEPGEGGYRIKLAASLFEQRQGNDWSYVEPDQRLQDRLRSRFRSSLGKRYQPVSKDDGGW